MSNIDIIRAWKDEEYRNSLTEEERSQLPENPAGMIELSDSDMESLKGGMMNSTITACLDGDCGGGGYGSTRVAFGCARPTQIANGATFCYIQ